VYLGTGAGRLFRSLGDGRWHPEVVDPQSGGLAIRRIWGTGPRNVYVMTAAGIYRGR
jgi:hypothetical protein